MGEVLEAYASASGDGDNPLPCLVIEMHTLARYLCLTFASHSLYRGGASLKVDIPIPTIDAFLFVSYPSRNL
jgi:hypothetical protein